MLETSDKRKANVGRQRKNEIFKKGCGNETT